jgi:hypothetical protein
MTSSEKCKCRNYVKRPQGIEQTSLVLIMDELIDVRRKKDWTTRRIGRQQRMYVE